MALNSERGVTLVETLVALAIMGLVTVSILVLVGQNTRFIASAQDRTYASIAADNLMVQALADRRPLETGEELGDIEIAGRGWRYRRVVTETGIDGVYRLDIQILDGNEQQVLANATTLKGAAS